MKHESIVTSLRSPPRRSKVHRSLGLPPTIVSLVLATGLLPSCSGEATHDDVEYEHNLVHVDVETLDELAKRTELPDNPGHYLVEGDMVVAYEGLSNYYDRRHVQDKAIVTTIRDNGTGAITDAVRPNSMNIRYCFTGGWGGTELPLADAKALTLDAAGTWAGTARVRFNHVSSSDGASCTQTAVTNGTVDLVVKPNVGKPGAAFAWWYGAQASEMALGASMNRAILLHELGHVLGLDHEQHHDNSGLGCPDPGYSPAPTGTNRSWGDPRELTAYDSTSIMHYRTVGVASCSGGTPTGTELSVLDGVGVRSLYGNPDWWATLGHLQQLL